MVGVLFNLPEHSPDLNAIENVFHLLYKILREDAVCRNLTKEIFRQFSERIIETVLAFPIDMIDQSIKSIPRHIDKNFIKYQG